MKLTTQKRLAADILKCSKKRIKFDLSRLDDIKESITKADIKSLIKDKAITEKPIRGVSRARAKYISLQKRKGRRKGFGSRKGKKTARLPGKRRWINVIRLQRKFLKNLKESRLISQESYKDLYSKAKGGFFRSKSHLKLFIEEHDLIKKEK